jgi:hypothetical protein
LGIEVELFDDLEAVERDARGALDRDRQSSLYDSIDWLKLTREHVLRNVRLVAARARDDEGRSAGLFLQEEAPRRGAAFASWYTLAFAPIFSGEGALGKPQHDLRLALIRAIAGRLRRKFSSISLAPLNSEHVSLLASGFKASGWLSRRSVSTYNWIAETGGQPFGPYWDRRPGRLRNTVARKEKRGDLQIEILDHFSAAAWAEYEAVYQASWKPAEGSPPFVRAFAEQGGRWGALRLGIARQDGKAVAAQFWTVDGEIATIHKLAHDERAKSLSPGSLLTHAMFRHVIERDRPMLIDFGTGDDAYKADWMDEKRPLYRLDLYNLASPVGLASAAKAAAGALVRRLRND